jgi:hypothetical protein
LKRKEKKRKEKKRNGLTVDSCGGIGGNKSKATSAAAASASFNL